MSHPDIDIADQQTLLDIDRDELRHVVLLILSDAGIKAGRISIALVDDPTIHELNRQFLNHDYPTDVISFALEQSPRTLEGEIVVSTDTASDRSQDYGWQPLDELLLYVVHGTLHLVGYDDHDPDDRTEMRDRERYYMDQLGRTARYDEPGDEE